MTAPRDTAATRKRLIAEGIALICRHGYHGTGLKAILDATGVPKGSFYNYFASKDDFGAAIVREYGEAAKGRLTAAIAAAGEPVDGVRAFFDRELACLESEGCVRGCLIGLLANELGGCDGPLKDVLAESVDGTVGVISDALAASQGHGAVRADLDADATAKLLLDTWEGGLTHAKVARSTAGVSASLDALFAMLRD